MSSEPVEKVLALPEILGIVLEYLFDTSPTRLRTRKQPDLAGCLTVSNIWFHEAARVLWGRYSSAALLRYVKDIERRKLYSNFFQSLRIYNIEPLKNQLQGLEFKHLRKFVFCPPSLGEGTNCIELVGPVLSPSIDYIEMQSGLIGYDELIPEEFVQFVKRRCPHARIELDARVNQPTTGDEAESVARLLEKSSITNLQVSSIYNHLVSYPVFFDSIFYHSTLESLKMTFFDEMGSYVNTKLVGSPVINITRMTATIKGGANLGRLFECFPNLEELKVESMSQCPDTFEKISTHCTKLQNFTAVLDEVPLTDNILKLGDTAGKSLTHFKLLVFEESKDEGHILTDEVITQFASKAPHLQTFAVTIPGNCSRLTVDGICEFGKRCQKLESMMTDRVTYQTISSWDFDNCNMHDSAYFPNLKKIWPPPVTSSICLGDVCEQHFPRLTPSAGGSCGLCMNLNQRKCHYL